MMIIRMRTTIRATIFFRSMIFSRRRRHPPLWLIEAARASGPAAGAAGLKRPAFRAASFRRNSISALTLRRSSAAHFSRAS
jgi:hypothetical protein